MLPKPLRVAAAILRPPPSYTVPITSGRLQFRFLNISKREELINYFRPASLRLLYRSFYPITSIIIHVIICML